MNFDNLNAISTVKELPYKKLKDFPVNTEFKITGIKLTNTIWGLKYSIHCNNNFYSYLPQRICNYFDEHEEEFKKLQESIEKGEVKGVYLGNYCFKFIPNNDTVINTVTNV